MQGGYNVATLVTLLSDADEAMAKLAGDQLKHTLLVFDAFHDVEELHNGGNAVATEVLESWANAEWYTGKPEVPDKITVTVFKGEELVGCKLVGCISYFIFELKYYMDA